MQLPAFTLHLGDCLESLRAMPDNSVDSIVTDPPYGLSFMGKRWDYDVPSVEIWAECLRVLKPGGHLLAFAGTRTQHRMAVRIEDAGFEIRDMIAWVYGSGFPKSMDVSKAIDKAAGADRSDAIKGGHMGAAGRSHGEDYINAAAALVEKNIPAIVGKGALTRGTPQTDAARQWQGWGTALKPALEPITVARKPLVGTVAANVLQHGTGALNIDGCRVSADAGDLGDPSRFDGLKKRSAEGWARPHHSSPIVDVRQHEAIERAGTLGRWPANLIHSGEPEVLACFPDSNGSGPARTLKRGQRANGDSWGMQDEAGALRDAGTGSAARFFKQVSHDDEDLATAQRFMYCAKASKRDRDEGLEGFESKAHKGYAGATISGRTMVDGEWVNTENERQPRSNIHPTVKPTDLMAYLVRLVTPPGGLVLDPFMGSGSTGKAAMREGFSFIGCELSPEYLAIAEARIQHELAKRQQPDPPQPDLFAA